MTPNPAEVACFAIPGDENTSLRGRNVTGDVGRELSPHKGKVMCILDALVGRTEARREAAGLLIPDCTNWRADIAVEGLLHRHEVLTRWINRVWSEKLG
jgi:hypothetical protein